MKKNRYLKSKNPKYKYRHIEIWIKHNGSYPSGWQIHHINHKKNDNRIRNLIAIPKKLHEYIHYKNYTNNKKLNKTEIKRLLKLFKTNPKKFKVPNKFLFKNYKYSN